MPPARRSTRAAPTSAARESAKPYTRTNTRRSGSPSAQSPAASVSRTPPGGKNSLKLTVKAAPSKLRQAISGSQLPPNPYTDEASESDATPKPSSRTARATRNPRTVVEQDSDEDEDDDEDAEDRDVEDGVADVDGGSEVDVHARPPSTRVRSASACASYFLLAQLRYAIVMAKVETNWPRPNSSPTLTLPNTGVAKKSVA